MLMTHYVLPEAEAGDYDAIDTVFEQILDYVKTKQDNGDLKVVNPRQFYNIYSPFGKGYEKDYRRLALRTNYDTTSN